MSEAICNGAFICAISDKCKRPECSQECDIFRTMKAMLDYDMVFFSPVSAPRGVRG